MGTSSGCFCNSNLALGSVPLPFPISAGLAGASLQDPRLVPAWCPLASCARASGGSRPQVPCRAGGRDGRLEEGGGHARRVPPEGRRGDCGLRRGVAWCCEPPGWLPMWDRGAVGIESSLWAVGGVGASSHTVQAGRPAPGPSQRVSSTLTEPQCCFLGIPSGGGQGSWHSQGLLLSRRTVWEASQERLAGIQAWAHQGRGAHSPAAAPAWQPERPRRPMLFPRERRAQPGLRGDVVSGPPDWVSEGGRGGRTGPPSCPWGEETRGSSWVAKSGAGLCPRLALVTLGRLLKPQSPGLICAGGFPVSRMLIRLA